MKVGENNRQSTEKPQQLWTYECESTVENSQGNSVQNNKHVCEMSKCKHYKEWFDKKTLQLVAGLVARATKQWEK